MPSILSAPSDSQEGEAGRLFNVIQILGRPVDSYSKDEDQNNGIVIAIGDKYGH